MSDCEFLEVSYYSTLFIPLKKGAWGKQAKKGKMNKE